MKQVLSIVVTAMLWLTLIPTTLLADAGDWHDSFYQYRIPVVLNVSQAGWNLVPINASELTLAINENEEMKFNPLWFAWNQLKIVEVDDNGTVTNSNVNGGFCLVADSEELFNESITGNEQKVEIPTEKGAYYLVRYKSQGGGFSPMYEYEQIFPVGTPLRKHAYMSSYEPPLLQQGLKERERLLISDGQPMVVHVKNRFTAEIKDISIKEVKIAFLAEFEKPEKKHWMIYYQPMLGHYLTIPEMRHVETPNKKAEINTPITVAQKYIGKTIYRLVSNNFADIWFADSTVKLTPNTRMPDQSSSTIHLASAKNEAQSFQIVIRPKQPFDFRNFVFNGLKNDHANISSENITSYAVDYVPIEKVSYITPTTYFGKIGDPLVAVSSKTISPDTGNHILWITVETPVNTPPGVYKGELEIQSKNNLPMTLPISLTVYDFELPEFSSFRTNMGGQYFVKDAVADSNNIMQYHGLKTKKELKKLVRRYYDIMSINKFYPKSVALYSEIGMSWSAPPKGYNVDEPGNYFKLYDWDFSELNKDLKHYIDDLKVNSVCLAHDGPPSSNLFIHLPGNELNKFSRKAPHITMAWQTFREITYVAWDLLEGEFDSYGPIEISVDQFDRLILDYYRAIAQNLEEHGWLDKFYIMIDEGSNVKRLLHLLRLLKSDPLTARLKVVACMQSFEYFNYKEKPSDEDYAFKNLLTYMPQNDENYNRWEKYYFTDYDILLDREKLWNYAVFSSRIAIDVPGINNRIVALDVFNRGGSGFLVWDTILWESPYGDWDVPWPKNSTKNPWIDPYTRLGNGALSYFYPPRKDGPSPDPDFTIVPSLRVMTYRESVNDYEYAKILEDMITEAKQRGIDISKGEKVIKDIDRFFYNSVHWSQNDAWYLDLRERIAGAIVELKKKIK